MNKEKVILAIIYKKDNLIEIDFPNEWDVKSFELYGYLKLYLEHMEIDLLNSFDRT